MYQRTEDMDIQDKHLKVRAFTRERKVWECLFWPSSMSTSFCRMSVIATFRECYKQNFGMYEPNPQWLFLRIVARDETWVCHVDPETRQKSTTINSWNDHGHSVWGFGWWKFAWEFHAAQDYSRGCCYAAWFKGGGQGRTNWKGDVHVLHLHSDAAVHKWRKAVPLEWSMGLRNWAIPTSVHTLRQWLFLMWYFKEWVFGRKF